ncbi:unnamed protein product [Pedinophyceae sp. YPF-701]|nr:unnamed protein product [Pedinophyceae sp. YPF-701]
MLLSVERGASLSQFGPEPPKDLEGWVQDLYDDAPYDPELQRVLEGTDGDPDAIRSRMRAELDNKRTEIMRENAGEDRQMEVRFREVDTMDLTVWLEFYKPLSGEEQELVETVFSSWYALGKLGGYNSVNTQCSDGAAREGMSNFEYDTEELEDGAPGMFHEMSDMEFNGNKARIWLDLGTADELALDVLINSLSQFSREYFGIRTLTVGGDDEAWPKPGGRRSADERYAIDPMDVNSVPEGQLAEDVATLVEEDLDDVPADLRAVAERLTGGGFSIEDSSAQPQAPRPAPSAPSTRPGSGAPPGPRRAPSRARRAASQRRKR